MLKRQRLEQDDLSQHAVTDNPLSINPYEQLQTELNALSERLMGGRNVKEHNAIEDIIGFSEVSTVLDDYYDRMMHFNSCRKCLCSVCQDMRYPMLI